MELCKPIPDVGLAASNMTSHPGEMFGPIGDVVDHNYSFLTTNQNMTMNTTAMAGFMVGSSDGEKIWLIFLLFLIFFKIEIKVQWFRTKCA